MAAESGPSSSIPPLPLITALFLVLDAGGYGIPRGICLLSCSHFQSSAVPALGSAPSIRRLHPTRV